MTHFGRDQDVRKVRVIASEEGRDPPETYSLKGKKKGKGASIMSHAERRRAPLLAKLGDIHRPLHVRPVRYMGREWWAVDAEDTWPGMVMDLRRLGFEAVAVEDEVLVNESTGMFEPQLAGPAALSGFSPYPAVNPTIKIRRESSRSDGFDLDELENYDERYDEDEDEADFEDEDGKEAFAQDRDRNV